jgi:alpha-beta hydrolase superfamily lysophospholipase
MPLEEGILDTPDEISLHWNCWEPKSSIRGTVVLVHGYKEHSKRYDLVVEFLTGIGFRVVAYDQRGHGRSGGSPAFVSHFDKLLDDLEVVLLKIDMDNSPGTPVILWGHSMGGLVVLRYLQTRAYSVAGSIISAPWLKTNMENSWVKRALIRILGMPFGLMNMIAPKIRVPVGIHPKKLTQDLEIQQAYLEDPMVHKFVTPGLYRAALDAQKQLLADPKSFSGPIIFLVPDADQVVDTDTTLRFVERISGPGIELCRLKGFRHEPHNETKREKVFSLVNTWLDSNFFRLWSCD